MARASKRDFIVETATGIFLEQGFKGTSIDMVVNACKVSKPTVYNHFPDKSQLIDAVIDDWLRAQKPIIPQCDNESALWCVLNESWWRDEAIAMYRLVIGEGWRFDEAAQHFWREYDAKWREYVEKYGKERHLSSEDIALLQARVSHELWTRLSHGGEGS
ncbi:TetR family transcriptional regulator [Hahella sp. KA22]|uniref:TetR/AcrR family transcriptional regulator n=1 Tax=Hahella sp. KA22 TaxID=1628392 RepID=UPI000FDF26D4|nr:TetR/AcrR family transcriptional regulator [Hahella sp. KA22]AZZ95259.1 TetR/AcrR family transcriptional regulator [Hahella sp. KA22]QAY52904.1 TetR family transcriptional regulator [Hahella sp. KA22]